MDGNIHANPEKIEKASHEMLNYADFLESECTGIGRALDALSSAWRDDQYREFEKHFLGMSLELKALIEKIRKTKPVLDDDIKRLRELQSQNLPRT